MNQPTSRLRRIAVAIIVTGCAAAGAGCTSGSHTSPSQPRSSAPGSPGGAARIPDPASISQIKSRTLGPKAEVGFRFLAAPGAAHRAAANPFKPPAGTVNHVCNALIAPFLFLPQGLLSSSTSVFPQADRRSPAPANWFEYVIVYPGGEAASMQAQLRTLLGRCGHFRWTIQSTPVQNATPLWMHAAVTSLPGIGDSTMYASMRTLPVRPGAPCLAFDWVLIRSGNTLIVLDDQGSLLPATTAPNTVMTQLASDAWQRYSTG